MDTDSITLDTWNLATGNYNSDPQRINESRTGLVVQITTTALNAANGSFKIISSNDNVNYWDVNNEAGDLPLTIPIGTSISAVSMAGWVFGEYIKFVFTRNSVTSGTIQISYLPNY